MKIDLCISQNIQQSEIASLLAISNFTIDIDDRYIFTERMCVREKKNILVYVLVLNIKFLVHLNFQLSYCDSLDSFFFLFFTK